MRTFVSIPLAGLFVFLSVFNVWIMLTGRGATPSSRRIWSQIHRVCGYAFISLFVIFCYFMLLGIRSADELSPRNALHLSLALILAPVLVIKVIVVRYQKSAWTVLMTLGATILAIAFAMVSMNAAVHYLRNIPAHRVPLAISLRVVLATIVAAATAFFAKVKQVKPATSPAPVPSDSPPNQHPSSREQVFNLTLARIETQTHDAKTLRFILPSNQQILPMPGQFLTFDWIIEGKLVKRSYTTCSSPTQRSFVEITPKRAEKGHVSKFLNDHATVGLTVKARGPYGKFHLDASKHQRVVFIAAGSGITPIIAMLRYIDDLCLKVNTTLIYCVRTKGDVIFENELAAIQERVLTFRLVLVLSQAGSEWNGWKGRLRREVLESEIGQPLESTFFLCGPPPWMELVRSLLTDTGVDSSRVLQESFGGGISGERAPIESTGPLEVRLSRSGLTYPHVFQRDRTRKLRAQWSVNSIRLPTGQLWYLRHKTARRSCANG